MAESVLVQELGPSDFSLTPGSRSVWVQVDNIVVHIVRQDEGVSVYFYPAGREDDEALVESWCTFGEAQAAIDEAKGAEDEDEADDMCSQPL